MRAPWQPSNIVKSPADGAYHMLVQRDDHGPAVGGDVQGTCVLRTRALDDPASPSRNFDTTGQTPYLFDTRVNSTDPRDYDLLRVKVRFQKAE